MIKFTQLRFALQSRLSVYGVWFAWGFVIKNWKYQFNDDVEYADTWRRLRA